MDFETFKKTILKKYPYADFVTYSTNPLNHEDMNGLLCWPKQKLVAGYDGTPEFTTSPDDNFGFCIERTACIERTTEDQQDLNVIFEWRDEGLCGKWKEITDEQFISKFE